jgi:hypothetical protein
MTDIDNRTAAFLAVAPTEELIKILVKHRSKNSSTNEKGCLMSGLKPQQHGYCQASVDPDLVMQCLGIAGLQLKVPLHQIAAVVLNGARPLDNEAHHCCRVRSCFRWTPDQLGRKHIQWVSKEVHKTIMCPINLMIDVVCDKCHVTIHVNVCTDAVPPSHTGPACF